MKKIIAFLFIFMLGQVFLFAQKPKKWTSGEIYNAMEKLNFLGTVLYIAAHPDDENTRLISYFSNDVKAQTAYLSLTRGDGGQNLIGPELRESLGVIRTQELLAARRIDGGKQFFTRANDFGYSKNPDETLKIWNKEAVLQDVVSVIRKIKPDIIINRFDHRTPGSTHGHHTSSAMLSIDAYDLAADKDFKTLNNDEVWQPKRLFFNTSWWFYGSEENFNKADKSNLMSIDIGSYYIQKGLSNGEISALSRSSHQSQGFGSSGSRGSEVEYLEILKGDLPAKKNVFGGIDTSWNRVEGGRAIGEIINEIIKTYDFENPTKSIPKLIEAYLLMKKLDNGYWKSVKTEEVKNVIAACSGLYLEAVSNNSFATKQSNSNVNVEIINRSDFPILLKSVEVIPLQISEEINIKLQKNITENFKLNYQIPLSINYTAPYWLLEKGDLGMYKFPEKKFIGLPETPKELAVKYKMDFNGTDIEFTKNIVYKNTDPVKGEIYQPFEILPDVSVGFVDNVVIFPSESARKITVKVKALKDSISGNISLDIPEEWKISPKNYVVNILRKSEEQYFNFNVSPSKNSKEAVITPILKISDKLYSKQLVEINYPHIPFQTILMPSEATLVKLNIEKKGQLIGYIQGAGDEIPVSLRQIGYTVVELKEDDISFEKLKHFDAVILGIRAYNTNDRARFYQKELHKYAQNGGTLIVQYNTSFRLKVDEVAPYPIKLSHDRVTEEDSEVVFLNPAHEVLNFPNKITQSDFKGWTQERGLYFPSEWDTQFETVLSMNDTNESPKNSSLLIAKYGKGYFIYTGLSFFRELPAGVPGAYKLFANMISIGKNKKQKTLKQ